MNELGFVGCNLNPDPSGGHWTGPPLTDRAWYPFFEKMVELDVPVVSTQASHLSVLPKFKAELRERVLKATAQAGETFSYLYLAYPMINAYVDGRDRGTAADRPSQAASRG